MAGFGFVIHEIDVRAANSYVLRKAKEDKRLLPLLLATPRDPGALQAGYEEAQALGVPVYGVKPYFDFADKPGGDLLYRLGAAGGNGGNFKPAVRPSGQRGGTVAAPDTPLLRPRREYYGAYGTCPG